MEVPKSGKERRLSGAGISEGVALGRVTLLERDTRGAAPFYVIEETGIAAEQQRIVQAIHAAAEQMDALIAAVTQRISAAQANIFVAQKMMILDEVLLEQMRDIVAQRRVNAETAISTALDVYESLLSEVDSEYLKERASDIGEIRRRLLDILLKTGGDHVPPVQQTATALSGSRILVAEELTPGETVALDTAHTVAFITERGGPASHAAILARALGIPAVSGVKNILAHFAQGEEVLVNGATGEIVVCPAPATLRLYPAAKRPVSRRLQAVAPVENLTVMANINLSTELEFVKTVLAEGVGLYRTEFELLAAGRMLSEDEQYQRYASVVDGMAGRAVFFRLFDLGSDKSAPFLEIPPEENPCLGCRGARLLLSRTDWLITQARALARASAHGPIHVVYPMISELDQFLKLRELFEQSTQDLSPGEIKHGVMLEVPSACLAAREVLEASDFASIGSNDLVQYLFAIDRNNERVAADYRPDRPVFWRLLAQVMNAARETGKPVSLCGEIGGQPQFIPKLLELGIRTVSVNPRFVGLARVTARRAAITPSV